MTALLEAIAALRAKAEAATPGPWVIEGGSFIVVPVDLRREAVCDASYSDSGPYIAAFHPGVALALCEVVEKACAMTSHYSDDIYLGHSPQERLAKFHGLVSDCMATLDRLAEALGANG